MGREKSVGPMNCEEFVSFLAKKKAKALGVKNLTPEARYARDHMLSCSECMRLTAESLKENNGKK